MGTTEKIPIITIDGPVGSGKGSLSVMVARHLNYHLLDSGALYRVLALAINKRGIEVTDETKIHEVAVGLNIAFKEKIIGEPAAIILDDQDVTAEIRQESCGNLASVISSYSTVRAALMGRQREFLKLPGLVADGRDMGTVVYPDAWVKFFLTASQEVRANRRWRQLQDSQSGVNLTSLLDEIKRRDDRDINRVNSPLRPAPDAIIIDSSEMTINQVLTNMINIINKRLIERAG
ncbi:MAG: (d)CMP kinase [Gammaproteobacteria bacterium]|nr:(d)CMP kinase [Gammaproteobacteria bacterium]